MPSIHFLFIKILFSIHILYMLIDILYANDDKLLNTKWKSVPRVTRILHRGLAKTSFCKAVGWNFLICNAFASSFVNRDTSFRARIAASTADL